jgi:hypothetical protein
MIAIIITKSIGDYPTLYFPGKRFQFYARQAGAALIGLVLVFIIGVHFDIKSAFADVAPVPLWSLQLSGKLDGVENNLERTSISPPQSEGKPTYGDGSQGGDGNTRRIKSFENLNNDEWREVIGGAVFLVGLCFLVGLMLKSSPL